MDGLGLDSPQTREAERKRWRSPRIRQRILWLIPYERFTRCIAGGEDDGEQAGSDAVGELDIDLVSALDEAGGDAGVEHLSGFVIHCDRDGQSATREIVRCERAATGRVEHDDVVAGGDDGENARSGRRDLQLTVCLWRGLTGAPENIEDRVHCPTLTKKSGEAGFHGGGMHG